MFLGIYGRAHGSLSPCVKAQSRGGVVLPELQEVIGVDGLCQLSLCKATTNSPFLFKKESFQSAVGSFNNGLTRGVIGDASNVSDSKFLAEQRKGPRGVRGSILSFYGAGNSTICKAAEEMGSYMAGCFTGLYGGKEKARVGVNRNMYESMAKVGDVHLPQGVGLIPPRVDSYVPRGRTKRGTPIAPFHYLLRFLLSKAIQVT